MHSPYPCDGLIKGKRMGAVFGCGEKAKFQLGEDGLRACAMHLNQILDITVKDEYTLRRLSFD